MGVVDDVQVFGNEDTHDSMLQDAMVCMEKQALCIVLINVLLRQNVVVSFGDQTLQKAVKCDLREVEAIKQVPPPVIKQQLLGMVNHLSILCQIFLA